MSLLDRLPDLFKILDASAFGWDRDQHWETLGLESPVQGGPTYWDVKVNPYFVWVEAACREPSNTPEEAFAAGVALRDEVLRALGDPSPLTLCDVRVLSVQKLAGDKAFGVIGGYCGSVKVTINHAPVR